VSTISSRLRTAFVRAVVLAIASTMGKAAVRTMTASDAQQQTPKAQARWPCGARMDPAYFNVAEGSGGHLLLLAPAEIGDSAGLLIAFGNHPQTIFRLAGELKPGIHEFHVPVDASVESLVVSISVQCLQTADILRPSGAPVTGDDVTELSSFVAERMVIVKRPEPGIWTIRAAGSGIGGVVVQARSEIGLGSVEFARVGTAAFSRVPTPGVENAVRITLAGRASRVEASLVNAAFRTIAPLELTAVDGENTYLSRFTPGAEGFRVVVTGMDASGVAFQRVHAPLFTPVR
jgi:hypothetical protein